MTLSAQKKKIQKTAESHVFLDFIENNLRHRDMHGNVLKNFLVGSAEGVRELLRSVSVHRASK